MKKGLIGIGLAIGLAAIVSSASALTAGEEWKVNSCYNQYITCLEKNPLKKIELEGDYAPGKVIVGFENYVDKDFALRFLKRCGYSLDKKYSDYFWKSLSGIIIRVPEGKEAEIISKLESECAEGLIKYAEPDYIVRIQPSLE